MSDIETTQSERDIIQKYDLDMEGCEDWDLNRWEDYEGDITAVWSDKRTTLEVWALGTTFKTVVMVRSKWQWLLQDVPIRKLIVLGVKLGLEMKDKRQGCP